MNKQLQTKWKLKSLSTNDGNKINQKSVKEERQYRNKQAVNDKTIL